MIRKQQTKETLRSASEHLFYEYWMFNCLTQSMMSGIFGQGAINNAVLESFTLHARALLDFLYSEKPKADDVLADDYFDDPVQWSSVKPEKTETLKMVHTRVGKEIAHLTYARLDINTKAKQWQFAQIANDLNTVFGQFLTSVEKDKLGPSWSKFLINDERDVGGLNA